MDVLDLLTETRSCLGLPPGKWNPRRETFSLFTAVWYRRYHSPRQHLPQRSFSEELG